MTDVLTAKTIVAETYEIEDLIARGAMGEVYRAKHLRLPGLQVAIKVMTQASLPPGAEVRFRREAEIAANLSHPNIVQVIDYNVLPGGEPYLVMELLKGENLHARLKRGPMGVEALTPIVRQVGAALDVAHQAGVVHRDLKPENIFLVPTPTGDQAKVLDFGISKRNDGAAVKTSDSMIIGTPRYMSPEQAMGHNSTLTPRSDVYSFAVVCYEALAGAQMFKSDSVAHLLYQVAQSPPPPMSEALPNVSPEVARALENALAKSPDERTPDIATFVREFSGRAISAVAKPPRGASKLVPAAARDAAAETRDARPSRSGALMAASAFALVAVSALVVVVALRYAKDSRTYPTVPIAVSPRATAGEVAKTSSEQEKTLVALEARAEAPPDSEAPATPVRPPSPAPVPAPRKKTTLEPETAASADELAKLEVLREAHARSDWATLADAAKWVTSLPRSNEARRKALVWVFEATCARGQTNVTALFNRIRSEQPDAARAAADACHRHLPNQVLE